MRTLIVNADDLGYTKGINAAVARCFKEGVVRSATLMANGQAFDDAVAMAKQNEGLRVGIHLALTGMPPVSESPDISQLLDHEGLLPSSPLALMTLLLSRRVSRRTLWRELDAQIGKVFDHGLIPTHLDSHKHVHVLPRVLEVLVELAAKYSIRWIRNPFESGAFNRMYGTVEERSRGVFLKQHMESCLTMPLRSRFLQTVRRAGLLTPQHFYGVSLTGIWNQELAVRLIEGLPDGISEWMVHPGICDLELRSKKTRLREQREREQGILCAPMLKELIEREGILLRPYSEEIG